MSRNLKIFAIMQFDDESTAFYNEVIKPKVEELGYSIQRADEFFRYGNILKSIIIGIVEADIIIAEVTKPNPNVYYELGLSHGLEKPALLLTQNIDHAPFDLRGYQHIIYSTEKAQVTVFCQLLEHYLVGFETKSIVFETPLHDFGYVNVIAETPTKNSEDSHSNDLITTNTNFREIIDELIDHSEKLQLILTRNIMALSTYLKTLTELMTENDDYKRNEIERVIGKVSGEMRIFIKDMIQHRDSTKATWELFIELSDVLYRQFFTSDNLSYDKLITHAEKVYSASAILDPLIGALLAYEDLLRSFVVNFTDMFDIASHAIQEAIVTSRGIRNEYEVGSAQLNRIGSQIHINNKFLTKENNPEMTD